MIVELLHLYHFLGTYPLAAASARSRCQSFIFSTFTLSHSWMSVRMTSLRVFPWLGMRSSIILRWTPSRKTLTSAFFWDIFSASTCSLDASIVALCCYLSVLYKSSTLELCRESNIPGQTIWINLLVALPHLPRCSFHDKRRWPSGD